MSNQSAVKLAARAVKTVIVNGSNIVITSAQRAGDLAPGFVDNGFNILEDMGVALLAGQDEFWEFDGFHGLSREDRNEIIRSKIVSKNLPKTMEEWRAKQAEEETKNQKLDASGLVTSGSTGTKAESKEEKK